MNTPSLRRVPQLLADIALMSTGTLLLLTLLLYLLNALFAASEIAVLSAQRSRLQELADRGERGAQAALRLQDHPARFLTTIQLAITLLGMVAAIYGGSRLIADLTGPEVGPIGSAFPRGWWRELAAGMVLAGLTATSVLVGELIPKRLALQHATTLACGVAPLLVWIERLAWPVVALLGGITDAVVGLSGARKRDQAAPTLHEIRQMIAEGTSAGLVDPVEQKLAFEALQLGDRNVRQIMRPRFEIDAIDVSTPPDEVLGVVAMAGYSRLPVYDKSLDSIIGFIHIQDVLRQSYLGWGLELKKLLRKAVFVPDTMRLDQLLVRFQEERSQLAIVVDEFGSTRGMVTLDDVLQELVGELLTEHQQANQRQIVVRPEGGWLVEGTVSVADLLEFLGKTRMLVEAPRGVSSVAGLVLHVLGRLPEPGESAVWRGLRFEVVDLDGRRIDKLLLRIEEPPANPPRRSAG
ncbi:MAG: hemolysin family protein [Planctomycetaceae bacterium]